MKFKCLLFSALIVIVDQITKFIAKISLKPIGKRNLISGILDLTYVENSGAAFGILSNQTWLFVVITVAVISVFLYEIFKNNINDKLFLLATSFIIGGAVGNLIDRILFGYVVDYIHFSFFPPVCNIADYCVTIGAILLIIYFFNELKRAKN